MEIQRQVEIPLRQIFTRSLCEEQETILLKALARGHTAKPKPFLSYFREMFEAALGVSTIAVFSLFMPSTWASSHLMFCAFFSVVFAIAVRYRRATAYSVGLLAAVSYSLLLWQDPQMPMQFDLPHILIEPFLLLLSGVLTSDILLAQRRRFIMAEQEHARTYEFLQETIRKYQTALTINTELERQIAGQTASVATISDKIAQLWKLHDNERYSAIVDMVMHALEAQSCALYVQHNQKMYLSACRPAGVYKQATALHLDDPLISRVLRYRQVSTIRDVLAQEKIVSQKVAVMAGPLINQNGQVVGIVIVDNIPMLKFTPSAAHLFSSILHMASIALQTASPRRETDQNRYGHWVALNPTEHTIPAGSHPPLPALELDQSTYRSWVALNPTEHTIPAVKLRGM